MSTPYLRRVLEGQTSTPEEWNDHLIEFHRQFGYATCGPMSIMRTSDGASSYQFAAERLHSLAPDARAILDVGCGDGLLLRRLAQLYRRDLDLVGLDLSESELERAAALFPDARYICADARTVDLGVDMFDAAISHLVLMIASQPERILRTVRRALHSNGILITVVQSSWNGSAMQGVLGAAMGTLLSLHQSAQPAIPERGRFEDDDESRRIFGESGFSSVNVERYHVGARFTRAEAWAFVQRAYPIGLLALGAQDAIHAAVDAKVTDLLEDDGRFEAIMPLQMIVARA